ncbi:Ras association domain-containing protein 1, partial [Fasciolopsis buskii]
DSKARTRSQNACGTVYFTASTDLKAQIRSAVPQTPRSKTPDSNEDSPNGSLAFYTPQSSPVKPNLSRHDTDLGQRRRLKKTNLASRHSFLAGHGSDATIYSRLSYDFSSLDKEAIRAHGIRVRQLNPCTASADKPPGLPISPKHPPIPPQRKSSLLRPKENVSCTSSEASPKHAELGLASVMQNTEAFVKSKPKYGKRSPISPVSPVPLTSVVVGPRGRLPYTVDELAKRLSAFNMNEFGLQALSLISAEQALPSRELMQFVGSMDVDGRIPQYVKESDQVNGNNAWLSGTRGSITSQVLFRLHVTATGAKESVAHFEAVVQIRQEDYRHEQYRWVSVNRLDQYEPQAWCLPHTKWPEIRPFCIC